jgi:hypothetical protein
MACTFGQLYNRTVKFHSSYLFVPNSTLSFATRATKSESN